MNNIKSAPRRGRPSTRNKEHVLDTAMNALWKDEMAGISINAICEIAEVSKPSLYRDFGSEDGLTASVLERYANVVLMKVAELLLGNASFSDKLDALIDFICDDPQMDAGCLFVKMRSTRSRFGVKTQSKISEIEKFALQIYTRFFIESLDRGEWSGRISAELAAAYLQEQLGLASTQKAAGRGSDAVRELLELAMSALKN